MGRYTIREMIEILEHAYTVLVNDMAGQRASGADLDNIANALEDIYYAGTTGLIEELDENFMRPDCPLTQEEVIRRLALTTRMRIQELNEDERRLDLEEDLELLDALKDIVEIGAPQDWTITRECKIEFD